jgi:Kelch motif
VGSLNTARETAAVVVLPNNLTLIVGGEDCAAASFGGTAGFQCNALNTAELYNESTQAFTFAGSGSGGVMTIARSGPSATLISGSGTALDGQVLIVGGGTGSSFLSTSPPPGGSGAPPANLTALNNAELYNPATDAFTATTNSIPGCPAGTSCATGLPSICPTSTSNAISTTSESGTTVTVTMSSANPTGLTVGEGVTISNVSCPSCTTSPAQGYNGSFTVNSILNATQFTYTSPFNGTLTAGSGGTAASDTAECGMVDQGAALIPNDSGKVLIAGGDILAFLGQSSNLAFLFDPSTQTFTRTASMTNARELFPLTALTAPPVTGALVGQVVAMGGIQSTSAICLNNPATPVLATTLNSAEVYDPATATWSPTTNNMFVARTTTVTLLNAGHDTGEIIVPGGVDVEAGTEPSTCAMITSLKQKALAETELYDPTTGAGGTFTATGSLNQPREGQAQGELGAGADITDFLVAGGACTTPSPSLQSVVIGTSQANTTCGTPTTKNAQNDYSEIYNQMAGTWTVGPTFATGFSPSNAAASAVLP